MSRKGSTIPRVKKTIMLSLPVVGAIGELREKLEVMAREALPDGIDRPVEYSQSIVIEMSVVALCEKYGVEIDWGDKQ